MMTERQPHSLDENEKKRPDFGSLIMFGLVFGAGAGLIVFDDAGVGAGGGLLLATIVNAYYEVRENAKGARTALAVGLLALVVFVAILIAT
jgi:hypothetical protein